MLDMDSDAHELSPAYLSPELSKHFRGLRMWLPLKLLGVAPFRGSAVRENPLGSIRLRTHPKL